jgi:hypothetical protein
MPTPNQRPANCCQRETSEGPGKQSIDRQRGSTDHRDLALEGTDVDLLRTTVVVSSTTIAFLAFKGLSVPSPCDCRIHNLLLVFDEFDDEQFAKNMPRSAACGSWRR